jgi:hypothetical protein
MKKTKDKTTAVNQIDAQVGLSDKEKTRKIIRSKDYTCSVISAGVTASALHDDNLDLGTVLGEFTKMGSRVVRGKTVDIELMLLMQAETLNIVFNRMLVNAANSELMVHFEKFTEIALKAQNQSRQALAALGELKHPRRATFIKQQNNAHNQQVNNNCADDFSKKIDDSTNELLREGSDEPKFGS